MLNIINKSNTTRNLIDRMTECILTDHKNLKPKELKLRQNKLSIAPSTKTYNFNNIEKKALKVDIPKYKIKNSEFLKFLLEKHKTEENDDQLCKKRNSKNKFQKENPIFNLYSSNSIQKILNSIHLHNKTKNIGKPHQSEKVINILVENEKINKKEEKKQEKNEPKVVYNLIKEESEKDSINESQKKYEEINENENISRSFEEFPEDNSRNIIKVSKFGNTLKNYDDFFLTFDELKNEGLVPSNYLKAGVLLYKNLQKRNAKMNETEKVKVLNINQRKAPRISTSNNIFKNENILSILNSNSIQKRIATANLHNRINQIKNRRNTWNRKDGYLYYLNSDDELIPKEVNEIGNNLSNFEKDKLYSKTLYQNNGLSPQNLIDIYFAKKPSTALNFESSSSLLKTNFKNYDKLSKKSSTKSPIFELKPEEFIQDYSGEKYLENKHVEKKAKHKILSASKNMKVNRNMISQIYNQSITKRNQYLICLKNYKKLIN